MICVLFLFCAIVVNGNVPIYPNRVALIDAPGIVLAAHNNLDGKYFSEIKPGDFIRYYDGEWEDYKVTEIVSMQALEPFSPSGPLVEDGIEYTSTEVWKRMYTKELVLQTCIKRNGNWKWGRLFIVAEEYDISTVGNP